MAVTLYPDGVSNANIGSLGAAFPAPDPTRVASFFDDFYSVNCATGTTAATWRALGTNVVNPVAVGGSFGRALFSPAGTTDMTYLQLASTPTVAAGSLLPNFFFVAGRDVWFQTSFQVSDASLSVINAGLFPSIAATGAAPEAAADGVFFTKASGTTTLTLKAIKTGVGNSTVNVATLVTATDIKVGFHYNGVANTIYAYVSDTRVASIPATNMPAVGLLPLIGHQSNTATRTSNWDYVFAAQARQSEAVT